MDPEELKTAPTFGAIFHGAGAVSVAAMAAKFKILYAIEPRKYFNIKTFRTNFPSVLYNTSLESFYAFKPDVIWASPSCGKFSSAQRSSRNVKSMHSMKFQDHEVYMFIEEIIKRKPKIFVLENIEALKNFIAFESSAAGFQMKYTMTGETLPLYDYYIEEYRISPTEFGFPQKRPRYFWIASKLDNVFFLTPPEKDMEKELGCGYMFDVLAEAREQGVHFENDVIPKHSEDKIEKIKRMKYGETLYGSNNNRRIDPNKCVWTVMTGATNFAHPFENRVLTVRETATLMGYPLDFKLFGSDNACRDQLGKGIIPHAGYYILNQINAFLRKQELTLL
jgi:DNA (cytosine-5)-methyltransferase 1